MVCSLRFENGRVRFTNRFVRSVKFSIEEEAGRPIFRTFGTSFENDRLKRGIALESPVNVSVYPYQDSVLVFGEQGLPWELDPVTLETRGASEVRFSHRRDVQLWHSLLGCQPAVESLSLRRGR
jgi:carotenoid cleavage dioxygenase-like enzyme